MREWMKIVGAFLLAASIGACGGDAGGEAEGGEGLAGRLQIDGSSTVYPISQAMAEEFMRSEGRDVRITVSQSGTGGGFRRFCAGETEISDASREIQQEEMQACEQAGVEPVQFQVATDGITVAVNPANDFVQCVTVEELQQIWQPGSEVQTWSDVRPSWPGQQIKLYGPGTSSGTFDYFTEAIMGEEDRSRQDYTASEDDNVLVQGVSGDPGALGYFGYAYYEENQNQLKAVAVDSGSGCVEPTAETIASGDYAPLSRPMFIYASRQAMERPEVRAFLEYYMENAPELVPAVGYIPLDASSYEQNLSELQGLGAAN